MLEGIERVKAIFPNISFDRAVKHLDKWIFTSLLHRSLSDSTYLKMDKPAPFISEELFPYSYFARKRVKFTGLFHNRWMLCYSVENTANPAEPKVSFSLKDRLQFDNALGKNTLLLKVKPGSFYAHWDLGFHQLWHKWAFEDYALRYGALYLNPYLTFAIKKGGRETEAGVGAVAILGDLAQLHNRITAQKSAGLYSYRWQHNGLFLVERDFIFNLLFSLRYAQRLLFDYRRAIVGYRFGKFIVGSDCSIADMQPSIWTVSKIRASALYEMTQSRRFGLNLDMREPDQPGNLIQDVSVGYEDRPQKHICFKAKVSLKGLIALFLRIQLQGLTLEGICQTSIKDDPLEPQMQTFPTFEFKLSFIK